MQQLKINTLSLSELRPCETRLDNWKQYHNDFNGNFIDFLQLTENITHQDKIWVAVRVLPKFLTEVFAIDCTFRAGMDYAAYADADAYAAFADTDAYAAYATYAAAAYAAGAYADVYAARQNEKAFQIEALIYLIKTNEGENL